MVHTRMYHTCVCTIRVRVCAVGVICPPSCVSLLIDIGQLIHFVYDPGVHMCIGISTCLTIVNINIIMLFYDDKRVLSHGSKRHT